MIHLISMLLAVLLAAPDRPAQPAGVLAQGAWASDPVWHDGLVEKATYEAEMVIYGRPRRYEAVFFTNKEQHDPATLTKAAGGAEERIEVWKHNQVEVVPTPNYDYKFVTTSHLTTQALELTRLDATSQEWCGTSFKQYRATAILPGGRLEGSYRFNAFSYLPEQGSLADAVEADDRPLVPYNALPLWLRGYDFAGRPEIRIDLLPNQKSNALGAHQPRRAVVRFAGETADGYELSVALLSPGEGPAESPLGTFTFARDRNHVMLAYAGADGQRYRLVGLERVDYWTRHERD